VGYCEPLGFIKLGAFLDYLNCYMEIVKKCIFFSFLSHATDLTEHWKMVRYLLHVHTNVYHTLRTLGRVHGSQSCYNDM